MINKDSLAAQKLDHNLLVAGEHVALASEAVEA